MDHKFLGMVVTNEGASLSVPLKVACSGVVAVLIFVVVGVIFLRCCLLLTMCGYAPESHMPDSHCDDDVGSCAWYIYARCACDTCGC